MYKNLITIKEFAAFEKRAKSQKKISRVDEGISGLKTIFNYINFWNSYTPDVTTIENRDVEDILIPEEFKDFIIPNSVRYEAGDRVYSDLLVRPEFQCVDKDDKFDYDYNEYLDACHAFRGLFKRDFNSGYVSLASLRVDKSFENVRAVSGIYDPNSSEVICHYMSSPFIALELANWSMFVRPLYFNATASEVLDNYVAKISFSK